MIVAIIVTIVLAVVVLLFVLEPVIRARPDRVEIDAIVPPEQLPDFRALLSENAAEERDSPQSDEAISPIPASNPEPAERHS